MGDSEMQDSPQAALERAIAAVPVEQFHGADGQAVRPCTPAHVTHRHLRMLDVRPGAKVLEIGIGSGYSAALLAQLAGPAGSVTAVEIDPDLAKRAEGLFAEHGHDVAVVTGNGLLGHPAGGPFDRILVGATPPAIPDAWLQQLNPGGTLLCGARLADLPGAYGIARITVDAGHRPKTVEVHHGGYTPMFGPSTRTPATCTAGADNAEGSLTLVGTQGDSVAATLLAQLTHEPYIEPAPIDESDYVHLKNWLLAAAPHGLLETVIEQGAGVGLGLTSDDGGHHVAVVTDEHLIADSADSPALTKLRCFCEQWRKAGSPDTRNLGARLVAEGDAWRVQLSRVGTERWCAAAEA